MARRLAALIITPANAVQTVNVAEVVRLRFSPPHPKVSRLLLLAAPADVRIKAAARWGESPQTPIPFNLTEWHVHS